MALEMLINNSKENSVEDNILLDTSKLIKAYHLLLTSESDISFNFVMYLDLKNKYETKYDLSYNDVNKNFQIFMKYYF